MERNQTPGMKPEERDRLTKLETLVAGLHDDMTEMKALLMELRDAGLRGQGAWRLALRLIGTAGLWAAAAAWLHGTVLRIFR